MKKGLCSSVKREDHELAITHIEMEKVIIPNSYYKKCKKYYPIYDHFVGRRCVTRGAIIGPLEYAAVRKSISLKKRSLYKKSIGLSEICRIIENVSTEDYR